MRKEMITGFKITKLTVATVMSDCQFPPGPWQGLELELRELHQ